MRVHFIGIGGIGVSALARYYLAKGYEVSGSDLSSSEITSALSKLGAKIVIGPHRPRPVLDQIDLAIYSPAVSENNPELRAAKKSGVKCQSYPQALGELTKKHFTIAICGSHGKSTTTAMVGIIMTKAGLDPTVIVGTKVREFGDSNCRVGKSKYLVIEADEHFSSFLNYYPKIIVLTSLEKDHLDYYKNFKNYVSAFEKFVSHLPKNGVLVINKDDKRILGMLKPKTQFKIKKYSLKENGVQKVRKILKIPGEFNVSNALAALSVARMLKIPDKISLESLSKYRGSWRRFEEKKLVIGVRSLVVIQDYAHHPTQVKVTLQAAREKFPKKKIWCIFQPHQYQRTYDLFNDFVSALSEVKANKVIITDIYDVPGREQKDIKDKVSAKRLVEAIKKKSCQIEYVSQGDLEPHIKKNLKKIEVLLIMGAGDIYNLNFNLWKIRP